MFPQLQNIPGAGSWDQNIGTFETSSVENGSWDRFGWRRGWDSDLAINVPQYPVRSHNAYHNGSREVT